MGRINRRIYATRRKRSSAFKMFAPQNTGPRREYSPDEIATAKSRRQSDLLGQTGQASVMPMPSNREQYEADPTEGGTYGVGPQTYGGWGSRGDVGRANSMPRPNLYQTHQPPYLGGSSDEAGIGGGKTYTITEA